MKAHNPSCCGGGDIARPFGPSLGISGQALLCKPDKNTCNGTLTLTSAHFLYTGFQNASIITTAVILFAQLLHNIIGFQPF